jgi:putative FmdB family regulatory protein
MPRYDYDCMACGQRVEVVHGVHSPGPTQCPSCGGGPLKKAIAAPAVHFKGSGWAKKERRATVAPGTARAAGEAGATSDPGAKSEGDSVGGKAGESASDGEPTKVAGRPAASSKSGGGGTATRTD